ncbi:MAG: pentapeptide repeat-containing protein [Phormidesmis sp.]
MAEIDFLALIGQGSESWNLWRAENPDIQPDLSHTYLFGQVLTEFDLSDVNLERACLIGTNLRGANLRRCRLTSAYATNADFSGADLTEADLSRGDFSEAHFDAANLSNVQALGANFRRASFSGASRSGWKTDKATVLSDLHGDRVSSFKFGRKLGSKFGSRQRLFLGAGLGVAAIALLTLPKLTRLDLSTPAQTLPPPTLEDDFVSLPCNEARPPTQLITAIGYKYKNGAIYYGNFDHDRPADGRGTMIYASGNRYDGEYKNGQRSGCGIFTFSNGRRYIGQFKADQFHGKGTWILETGERYIGEFKNNQCNGKGTFIFANGSSKSGTWQAGKLLDGSLSCDPETLRLPASPSS